jgi:pimeloyl-ACP methyl ester carboxylesterase
MAVLAPHARLEIIADAGHSAHLEQPSALADALAHWMTSPRA